jgi:hypothetical protein
LARKKGTPKLGFRETLELIEAGKIQTRQIGRAPLWIVTASYPRMGIRIGSILTPNVSRKIFCVLDNLEDLLKQQKHILEDSYSRGEAPELDDVFETLVRLTHLGPQNRLNPKMSAKIATELSQLNIKIEKKSAQRQKIHEGISRVIQSVIKGLKKRTIRGKVSTAIEIVLNRMDQISGIIPLIELRRSAALREIIRQERHLWQLASTLKSRRNSISARNLQQALRRDLANIQAPDVQSYRLNVQNAKRTVHLAIIALRKNKPKLAQKYLDHAINILGYSPQDLSPHIARI